MFALIEWLYSLSCSLPPPMFVWVDLKIVCLWNAVFVFPLDNTMCTFYGFCPVRLQKSSNLSRYNVRCIIHLSLYMQASKYSIIAKINILHHLYSRAVHFAAALLISCYNWTMQVNYHANKHWLHLFTMEISEICCFQF